MLVVLLAWASAGAQQTTVFTEATNAYKRGVDFFNQQIYGLAQKEFRMAMDLLRPVNEPEWKAVKTDAELYHAKCAVRLGQPEAEKLTLDFLREHSPSPAASQAALEIGDYYFNQKEYDRALLYYDMAPAGSGATRDEIQFKKGYAFFVTKQFSRAKGAFAGLKENTRSDWYYPANYYYGCCAFFEGRYDEAEKTFKRCEQSDKYKQSVPYYLTQIYAARKQYDQVIAYGEPKTRASDIKNKPELNQLVGQAYYEKGDFKKALTFLEYAAANNAPLRPADYYQLGYAQYQTGAYRLAIGNFEELSKQDSLLGQNGLYHLGDAYLKTKNKLAARTAFGQAASMNFDKSVKEDALINYAKLSYELKYDRDAIDALQKIPATSKYYEDAQALMSEVFLNTRDYDRAITTLESVKNRTPRLNETYQKVCYYRGLQLYQNNQKEEARRYFDKSLDNPIDRTIAALSSYWMGAIANEGGDYAVSKQHLGTFLTSAKNTPNLPEESSMLMGQYIQGYNYMKLNDYKGALSNFKACVEAIRKSGNSIQNEHIKKNILGDATLRAGDCHFKNKQYGDAIAYYDEAVKRKYEGFEYALYQKSMIKGLQGNNLGKTDDLESLVNNYPNSRFTDEALFQLGDTYVQMDRPDQAIPPLRKLVADFRGKSPLVNQALLSLALIEYNRGNSSAAISYNKQVFANNPESPEASAAEANLREIYFKDLNKPDEFFAFMETVPGRSITNAAKDSVTYQSAEEHYLRGKYAQAIDAFTNYLTKFPNGRSVLPAYYYRAESYAAEGVSKYNMALKDYAAVVAKGPSRFYPKAAEKAAQLAFSVEKNYAQSFEFARKWEESASSDAGRLEAQGLALQSAYLTNNSVSVGEYADKINRSGLASPEQRALANFYVGKMAYDKGDYARAYPALQNTVQNATSEIMPEAYHLQAQILYKQRKYDQAEELIGDANKASAGYDDWIARNLILLSDVYVEKGDKNSASAALEALLENYHGDPAIVSQARQRYEKLNGKTPSQYNDNNTTNKKGGNFLETVEEGGN
ncbi:MAG TPA: tetratricopeptide repeat protein [Saprospiraceae bacterium]|nr:tetratricopeptide repeat protein [Saprospiraceae bacterium]